MDIKKAMNFLKNTVTRDSGFSPVFIANMDILIGYAEEQLTDKWIPVSEGMPPEPKIRDTYLVTTDTEIVIVANYIKTFVRNKEVIRWEWNGRICPWRIVAWRNLPEPYREE